MNLQMGAYLPNSYPSLAFVPFLPPLRLLRATGNNLRV